MFISGSGTRSSPISIQDDSEDEVFNELTGTLSSDDDQVIVYPVPHQGTYFAKLSKRHLSQEEARGLEQYRESLEQEVKKRKRTDSSHAVHGGPLVIDLTGQQSSGPTADDNVNTDLTDKRSRKRRRKSETTPERSRKKPIESIQNNPPGEGLSHVIKGGKKLRANPSKLTTQSTSGNEQVTLSSNGESSTRPGGPSTLSFLPDMTGCVSQHVNTPWPQLVSPSESYFHSGVLQQSMFPTPMFPSLPHPDLALPMLVNMAIGLENMAYMQQSSPYMPLATTSNIHSSMSSLPLKPINTSYATLPSRPNNPQSHYTHVTTPNLPSNPKLQFVTKIKRKPAPIGNSNNVNKHGFFDLPPPDPQQPNAPNDAAPPPVNQTLVMEQIPRPMRQASWVKEWAVSVCGQAPTHALILDKQAKALIEFANPELAVTAWKSKRLGTNEDGNMIQRDAALYNVRVYWYNPTVEERLKKKKDKLEKKKQISEMQQKTELTNKMGEKEKDEKKEIRNVKEDEKVTIPKGNVEPPPSTLVPLPPVEQIPTVTPLRVGIEAIREVREVEVEVEVEAVDQKLEEGEIVDLIMEGHNHINDNASLEPGEFDRFEEEEHRRCLALKEQQEERKRQEKEQEREKERRQVAEAQHKREQEVSIVEKEHQDGLDRQRAELLQQRRRRVGGHEKLEKNSKELQMQADIERVRKEWNLRGRLEHEERDQRERELKKQVLRERERISTFLPATQREILMKVATKQKQQQSPPAFRGIPTGPRLASTSNIASPSTGPLSSISRTIPTGPRKAASSTIPSQPQDGKETTSTPTPSQYNATLPPKPILQINLPPRPSTGGGNNLQSLSQKPVARPTSNISSARGDMDMDVTSNSLPSSATLITEATAAASGPNSCAQGSISNPKSTMSLPHTSASVPVTEKRVPIAPKAMLCALEPSPLSGQAVKQSLAEVKDREIERTSPSQATTRENISTTGLSTARQQEQSSVAVQEANLDNQQFAPVSSLTKDEDVNLSDAAVSLIKEALSSVNLSSNDKPQKDEMGSSSSSTKALVPPRKAAKKALAEKQQLLEREIQVTKELMQQMTRTQTRQDKERIMTLLREKSRFMDQVSNSIRGEYLITSGSSRKQVKASSRWTRMRWPESKDDAGVFIISDDEDDEE